MQSRILVPDGYRAVVHPAPLFARGYGILTVSEELFADSRVSSGSNTVMVRAINKELSHMWWRPKDHVRVRKGQILGVLRIVKKT